MRGTLTLALILSGCSVLYESDLPAGCVVEDGDGDTALSIQCGGNDCDDEDPSIFPGAMEQCNGLDDDCDGRFDEDLEYGAWYPDCDQDGRGDDLADPETTCSRPSAPPVCDPPAVGVWVTERGDCDDRNPNRTVACGWCARVDFLIVMDTSNSMAEEQQSLARQIPRVVAALKSGDVDGDGTPEAEPISDLHVGVVTPDLGSGDNAVGSCRLGVGDDGILRSTSGSSDPSCAGLNLDPPFLAFTPEDSLRAVQEFEDNWSCLVRAGTGGCGFEQPLEAVLKALTPASSPLRFWNDSLGQDDGPNRGFLREDSLLVLLLISDEDDCSARDTDLFNPSSETYTGDLNLRCHTWPAAVHPLSRYVGGLLARRRAADLIYGLVVGVPPDLIPADGLSPDYATILRDPRMAERPDIVAPTRLTPSCSFSTSGIAFPPRRLLGVGQGLEERGSTTLLTSICQTDAYDVVAAAVLRAAAGHSLRRCGPSSLGVP